jgi:hypothetical protein
MKSPKFRLRPVIVKRIVHASTSQAVVCTRGIFRALGTPQLDFHVAL